MATISEDVVDTEGDTQIPVPKTSCGTKPQDEMSEFKVPFSELISLYGHLGDSAQKSLVNLWQNQDGKWESFELVDPEMERNLAPVATATSRLLSSLIFLLWRLIYPLRKLIKSIHSQTTRRMDIPNIVRQISIGPVMPPLLSRLGGRWEDFWGDLTGVLTERRFHENTRRLSNSLSDWGNSQSKRPFRVIFTQNPSPNILSTIMKGCGVSAQSLSRALRAKHLPNYGSREEVGTWRYLEIPTIWSTKHQKSSRPGQNHAIRQFGMLFGASHVPETQGSKGQSEWLWTIIVFVRHFEDLPGKNSVFGYLRSRHKSISTPQQTPQGITNPLTDAIKKKFPNEAKYFVAHKISDQELFALNAALLRDMGVSEVGPRLAILRAIGNLKASGGKSLVSDHGLEECSLDEFLQSLSREPGSSWELLMSIAMNVLRSWMEYHHRIRTDVSRYTKGRSSKTLLAGRFWPRLFQHNIDLKLHLPHLCRAVTCIENLDRRLSREGIEHAYITLLRHDFDEVKRDAEEVERLVTEVLHIIHNFALVRDAHLSFRSSQSVEFFSAVAAFFLPLTVFVGVFGIHIADSNVSWRDFFLVSVFGTILCGLLLLCLKNLWIREDHGEISIDLVPHGNEGSRREDDGGDDRDGDVERELKDMLALDDEAFDLPSKKPTVSSVREISMV